MAKPDSRKRVTAFIALLLSAYLPAAFGHTVNLSCPATFGPAPDESGLIAYYPLDGNTADASGNGLDAIEVNAAEPAEGKIGQGYSFNGKDSYIRLPLDISPYVYPKITVTAWIKPAAVNGARYVVNQGDHGNRNLFLSNGAVSAGGAALVGDRKHSIYANRWEFVALTYDQATGTAVLLSGSTFSAIDEVVIPDLPRPSVLLGAKAPGNSVFDGVIDEVRIYDRALTTTELAGLKTESQTIGPVNADNACADVTCPTGQVCSNGGCFDQVLSVDRTCADITCPTGQVCSNGGCFDSMVTGTLSSIRETASAQPGVPSYGDESPPADPTQLSGDPSPSISAQDIPTSPEYQVADQNIVLDGTITVPESESESESESRGAEGGMLYAANPDATLTPRADLVLRYAEGVAHLTGISGRAGSIVKTVSRKPSEEDFGTSFIRLTEVADMPCRIKTSIGDVQNCLVNIGGQPRTARVGGSYRVIALQACTRKSNGRVKGLNIRGQLLHQEGLGLAYERDGFSRANCNDNWQSWVECPSGQVMTGYRAHFDGSRVGETDNLVGLQLYCRRLGLRPPNP